MKIIPFNQWILTINGCECYDCNDPCFFPENCLFRMKAKDLYDNILETETKKYKSIMENKCLV
jgi:hypothetical protein